MHILSHRGYWLNESEKNTQIAFERSFSVGFGVETDVRDFDGELVVSHDMAHSKSMKLHTFFELYKQYSDAPYLALNIKADGLQQLLLDQLKLYEIERYFVFDMAVPDGLLYARLLMKTYTRHSEYEPHPAFYEFAEGVWLDEFQTHWINAEVIQNHLKSGKKVCIVSPELHRRPYQEAWADYRALDQELGGDQLMICTDFPQLAQDFFNA